MALPGTIRRQVNNTTVIYDQTVDKPTGPEMAFLIIGEHRFIVLVQPQGEIEFKNAMLKYGKEIE